MASAQCVAAVLAIVMETQTPFVLFWYHIDHPSLEGRCGHRKDIGGRGIVGNRCGFFPCTRVGRRQHDELFSS